MTTVLAGSGATIAQTYANDLQATAATDLNTYIPSGGVARWEKFQIGPVSSGSLLGQGSGNGVRMSAVSANPANYTLRILGDGVSVFPRGGDTYRFTINLKVFDATDAEARFDFVDYANNWRLGLNFTQFGGVKAASVQTVTGMANMDPIGGTPGSPGTVASVVSSGNSAGSWYGGSGVTTIALDFTYNTTTGAVTVLKDGVAYLSGTVITTRNKPATFGLYFNNFAGNGFGASSLVTYSQKWAANATAQTVWYLNAGTGSDSNDGLTRATARKTFKNLPSLQSIDIVRPASGVYTGLDGEGDYLLLDGNGFDGNNTDRLTIWPDSATGAVEIVPPVPSGTTIGQGTPGILLRNIGAVEIWGLGHRIKIRGQNLTPVYGGSFAASTLPTTANSPNFRAGLEIQSTLNDGALYRNIRLDSIEVANMGRGMQMHRPEHWGASCVADSLFSRIWVHDCTDDGFNSFVGDNISGSVTGPTSQVNAPYIAPLFHYNLTLQDWLITNCPGRPTGTPSTSTYRTTPGNGILWAYNRVSTVKNCYASDCGYGNNRTGAGSAAIWFRHSARGLFQDCGVARQRTSGGIDGAAYGFDFGAASCVIERCYAYDCDGPALYDIPAGSGLAGASGCVARFCLFVNNLAGTTNTDAQVFFTTPSSIHNSIVIATNKSGLSVPLVRANGAGAVRVVNCVLIGSDDNNIYINSDTSSIVEGNYYYRATGGAPSAPKWVVNGATLSTYATYRSSGGKEVNNKGAVADPLFTSGLTLPKPTFPSTPPAVPVQVRQNTDYRPALGSPLVAASAGSWASRPADITGLAPTVDYGQQTLPATPGIGAFAFSTGYDDTPPTLTGLSINSAGTAITGTVSTGSVPVIGAGGLVLNGASVAGLRAWSITGTTFTGTLDPPAYLEDTGLTASLRWWGLALKDAAGNPMAAFSNLAVANNSTIPILGVYSVSVAPSTATVEGGATQQFTPTVSVTGGSISQAVTWSTTAGSIDSNGLYTAPESPRFGMGDLEIVVTATSVANPARFGAAIVTIPEGPPPNYNEIYAIVRDLLGRGDEFYKPDPNDAEADPLYVAPLLKRTTENAVREWLPRLPCLTGGTGLYTDLSVEDEPVFDAGIAEIIAARIDAREGMTSNGGAGRVVEETEGPSRVKYTRTGATATSTGSSVDSQSAIQAAYAQWRTIACIAAMLNNAPTVNYGLTIASRSRSACRGGGIRWG